MPIHDLGYRRYQGRRRIRGGWWVIALATMRAQARQRQVLALMAVAWAPFAVRAVMLYVGVNLPPQAAAMFAATPQTFREFLDWQNVFVFFIAILIGAGLIADDRRANALQLYLSRPLTRAEYVVGKLAALAAFLGLVTWLPAMLLVVLQVIFAGSFEFLRANLFIVPAITLFSLVQIIVTSCTILALSSLTTNRRFVAIMYAGVIFFTSALYGALRMMTRSRSWAWISPRDTLDVVADAIFRLDRPHAIPVWLACTVAVTLVIASVAILERRIRGVEVVS